MADPKSIGGLGKMLGGLSKPPSGSVEPAMGEEPDGDEGESPAVTAGADAAISAIETGDRKAFSKAIRAMFEAFQAQQQ